MKHTVYYGPGDAIIWAPCDGHPCDPRTDDEAFIAWEESVTYADVISTAVIDSVLFQLRHGNPDDAKTALEVGLRAAYAKESE